jgi:hypothetical protein
MNAINTIQKIIQSRCNELNITYKELVIKQDTQTSPSVLSDSTNYSTMIIKHQLD